MSQPRSTSNSLFFAQLGVDTFDARRRKLTHSFAARLLASGNGIISLLLRSDAFPRSQFWPPPPQGLYIAFSCDKQGGKGWGNGGIHEIEARYTQGTMGRLPGGKV
ncbi:hypothetical protein Bbelb_185100 [Branchiostoma belcheri]|nr:hypothetical protein Bbelb_185100 [Branchiostoma belcheri]